MLKRERILKKNLMEILDKKSLSISDHSRRCVIGDYDVQRASLSDKKNPIINHEFVNTTNSFSSIEVSKENNASNERMYNLAMGLIAAVLHHKKRNASVDLYSRILKENEVIGFLKAEDMIDESE